MNQIQSNDSQVIESTHMNTVVLNVTHVDTVINVHLQSPERSVVGHSKVGRGTKM